MSREDIAYPQAVCPLKRWQSLPSGITGGMPIALKADHLPKAGKKGEPPEVWGPRMWAELHLWALAPGEPATWAAWLAGFAWRLPACECRHHWRGVLAALPPPLGGTPADLFAWTVAAHNAVNRRKGKAEMPVEAANEHWRLLQMHHPA